MFELALMASMRRLSSDATGAQLREDLGERLEREVAVGQLYLSLAKLEKRGLIDFEIKPPERRRGGRSRKIYRLTPIGLDAVQRMETLVQQALDAPSFG